MLGQGFCPNKENAGCIVIGFTRPYAQDHRQWPGWISTRPHRFLDRDHPGLFLISGDLRSAPGNGAQCTVDLVMNGSSYRFSLGLIRRKLCFKPFLLSYLVEPVVRVPWRKWDVLVVWTAHLAAHPEFRRKSQPICLSIGWYWKMLPSFADFSAELGF